MTELTFIRKISRNKKLALWVSAAVLVLIWILYLLDFHFPFVITVIWLALIIPLILTGNKLISKWLQKRYPWNQYLSRRFFIQLFSVMLYALLCFNLSYFIFKIVFTYDPPTPGQFLLVNVYGALLVLPLFSIYYVIYFINEWNKSQIRSEKLEKESIQSQFDNLKNHLDPHFLFNNLNVLSSLIDKDVKSSKLYLTRFAEVYRFMLQNKSSELISLGQEMEFCNAYFHLVSIRFGDALRLNQKITAKALNHFIPPFTIQMLIENAVKHNAFNKTRPMTIFLESFKNYISIKNEINKPRISISSHGSGLKNIKARYKYFTESEVEVINTGEFFEVKAPLIELEEE